MTQTSSIGKRLLWTVVAMVAFFLIEFVGIYLSNKKMVDGLQVMHRSILNITHTRNLREILTVQQTILTDSKAMLSDDEHMVLETTLRKVDQYLDAIHDATPKQPEIHELIHKVKGALSPLYLQILRPAVGPIPVTAKPMIVDQYMLEAQEHLGKIQMLLTEQSNKVFAEVFAFRFVPLLVSLVLSSVFVFFAILIGFHLKRRIEKPIQDLVVATNAVAAGDLSARATVGEADEIGALTHSFNSMADRLESNIAEQKRVALVLQEAKQAAEAANRAKSAFLANMSHEIRTPLGAVIGFADLLAEQSSSREEKNMYISAIKRNGELLVRIINDVLDLSKIESGKFQISTQNTSLHEIIADIRTLFEQQGKEKSINFIATVEDDVPATIETDSIRLRQILINIIGNAVKFTTQGQVHLHVSRVLKNNQQLISFVVRDSGCGIPRDKIEKLFAPFSQADDSITRQYGGTGLGLMLAKRFANLLGGDVELSDTKLDAGSTFTITINPNPRMSAIKSNGARMPTVTQ
jgi:signal transduction histidine kinase